VHVTDYLHNITVFSVGFVASAINAFAFGGSLVSFPTLIWLGVPPIIANATNTAAVWPGSLGAVWGYRRELRQTASHVYWLIVPSVAGAIAGAMLLRITPSDVFDQLVPLLILFATVLFALQDRVQRMLNLAPEHHGSLWFTAAMVFQFFVSVYGGYFGAGMGILMLAALAVLGHEDIHQMNGIKNLLAVFINAVAAGYFILAGMVRTPDAVVMALGATIGGVAAAGVARRMGRKAVRRAVIAIGFSMGLAMFWRL
jgi:uncharacterized membrane protein YfcA